MKILKCSLLLFAILWLTNCNSTKKTSEVVAAPAVETPAHPDPQRGQRGDREGRRAEQEKRHAEMMAALNMSEAQKKKYDEITEKYRGKMQSLRQNNQGDREAMRESFQNLRAEQTKEIEGILTKEQFATYEEMMAERQGTRGGRGRGPGGNG